MTANAVKHYEAAVQNHLDVEAQALALGGAGTKSVYGFEFYGTHWVQTNTAQWL